MRTLTRALVVGVLLGLAGTAWAIPLVYEEGPLTGTPFVVGDITLKMTNYGASTLYPVIGPPGTSIGYSGPPGAAVGVGVAAVDGIGAPPPAGALSLGPYPGLEDAWGIGKVTRIQDASGDAVWTPAGKGAELTVYFWGLQDFYVEQIDSDNQRYDGAGMHFDLYTEPLPSPTVFVPSGGTAARTAANTYPTVTDGTLVLSGVSVPGFINAPGIAGGLATEFEAQFNTTTVTGDGGLYVSLIGGQDRAQFDTDGFVSPFGLGTADLRVQFDTAPATIADWLMTADDPVKGHVPEPATMTMLGLGALVLMRRKRK